MTFNDIICRKYPEKIMIENENKTVYYKDCLENKLRVPLVSEKELITITEKNNIYQLIMLYTIPKNYIPFVLPENLYGQKIECDFKNADIGVATSGTSGGKSKYYFRELKTWADFYPVQNKIFNISENTRIFIQGSMCYTGNLNTVSGALYAGASVYTSVSLRNKLWAKQIKKNHCNCVYLIPEKLVYLCKCGEVFDEVETVMCGSQLILKKNYSDIKRTFPNAEIILYYGSSEVSYVSYKKIENEYFDEKCVGKPFENVKVSIGENGHIFVDSDYLVCGAEAPYDTGDNGKIDSNGNIIFLGRDKKN